MNRNSAILWGLAATLVCCSSGSDRAAASGSNLAPGASCEPGHPLAGASYDVNKSRFAFGSKPAPVDAGTLVRWTGSDGVVAILADGSEMGVMNAGAPESGLPDWSADPNALSAHVTDYFVSMGVAPCQLSGVDATYSGGGGGGVDGSVTFTGANQTTSGLVRGIDGVTVAESLAYARFDSDDQTTNESFYWPTIPGDVVAAARAFHDQLAAPGALAAYKAKLPADAQGDGSVIIHHTTGGSSASFTAVATYDTVQITPLNDGSELHFDRNGQPVMDTWSF
ncbi:MAG TPA: hypothetical protein VKU41_22250 [Polyangiaceae bacterium]|nr:hypothetical protein [Polyangiaceae bacterium]